MYLYIYILYKTFHSLKSAVADYKALTSNLSHRQYAFYSYTVCPCPQFSCSSETQNKIQSISYTSLHLFFQQELFIVSLQGSVTGAWRRKL